MYDEPTPGVLTPKLLNPGEYICRVESVEVRQGNLRGYLLLRLSVVNLNCTLFAYCADPRTLFLWVNQASIQAQTIEEAIEKLPVEMPGKLVSVYADIVQYENTFRMQASIQRVL